MNTKIQAVALAAFSVVASASAGIVTDSTFDLFDNGLSNLDITQVDVSDDGVNLSVAVTTRGFQNWTKYMLYFDTATGGTSSNAWSRPVNLTSNIEHYVGSWVDAPSNNAQFWAWSGSWSQTGTFSNSVSGNTVTFTMSLASLGLSAGSTMYFDVATSGGGNDPGVDHLSRSDAATPGWGTASTSGNFIAYTVTPAPGALALLGVAGIVGARRRR
jgi:MYXO-CTERM domain-containing protein